MNQMIDVKFRIKKVLFTDSKNNFRIFVAKILNHNYDGGIFMSDEMSFKGTMISCKEKDVYKAKVTAEYDLQGRRFLKIHSVELEELEFEAELARFISKNVKGVTEATATTIVKKLGVDALDKIGSKDGVKILKDLKIRGIGEKTANTIRQVVIEHKNYQNLMVFLEMNNLDVSLASKIYENVSKNYCIDTETFEFRLLDFKKNPYSLIKHIDFFTLDVVGQRYINNPRAVDRIVAGIYSYVENDTLTNGNVYTEKADIYENLNEYMERNGVYTGFKVDKYTLEEAFEVITEDKLLKINGDFIYKNENLFMENQIARCLNKIKYDTDNISTSLIEEELRIFEELNDKELDDIQKQAVINAIQSKISVLTGGPGTGKTFTTNLILKTYKALHPLNKVLLLAPTGKASKRLEELCGEKAMTMHRGLGIRVEEQVYFKEKEFIEEDFIIVDEASMIDLKLFYNLLIKTKDTAKILLVGDYQQLPSVGAGLILRDLLDSNEISNTRLTRVFRQALESNIVVNSHKVIASKDFNMKEDFTKDCFFIKEDKYNNYYKKCLKIIKKAEENGYGIEDVMILTATNQGELGTKNLNLMFQDAYNKETKKFIVTSTKFFKKNDKVIHTKNNKELDVFNGEVGIVAEIDSNCIIVDYSDRTVVYSAEDAKELELAYVLTVHKSQGSEYPVVIHILPNLHNHILNRNLVYTAWTRAKKRLYVLGEEEALNDGAKRNIIANRKSRLIEKLRVEF